MDVFYNFIKLWMKWILIKNLEMVSISNSEKGNKPTLNCKKGLKFFKCLHVFFLEGWKGINRIIETPTSSFEAVGSQIINELSRFIKLRHKR